MSDMAQEDRQVRPAPSDAALTGSDSGNGESFEETGALLRLLIGALLVSADELRPQLERWKATRERTPSPAMLQILSESPRDAPLSDVMRHALVGMLFETEARTRRRLSIVAERLMRISELAEYVFTTRFEPMIRRTPLDPVLAHVDEALFMALATVDRWSARGMLEERQAGTMARQSLTSIADELLDYMSRNPEVRALIERQGTSMAEEAMDAVRDRTLSADTQFERFVRSLLRRPVKDAAVDAAPSIHASSTDGAGG